MSNGITLTFQQKATFITTWQTSASIEEATARLLSNDTFPSEWTGTRRYSRRDTYEQGIESGTFNIHPGWTRARARMLQRSEGVKLRKLPAVAPFVSVSPKRDEERRHLRALAESHAAWHRALTAA